MFPVEENFHDNNSVETRRNEPHRPNHMSVRRRGAERRRQRNKTQYPVGLTTAVRTFDSGPYALKRKRGRAQAGFDGKESADGRNFVIMKWQPLGATRTITTLVAGGSIKVDRTCGPRPKLPLKEDRLSKCVSSRMLSLAISNINSSGFMCGRESNVRSIQCRPAGWEVGTRGARRAGALPYFEALGQWGRQPPQVLGSFSISGQAPSLNNCCMHAGGIQAPSMALRHAAVQKSLAGH